MGNFLFSAYSIAKAETKYQERLFLPKSIHVDRTNVN